MKNKNHAALAPVHAVVRFWNGGIKRHLHNLSIEKNVFAMQMRDFPKDSRPWARAQLAFELWGLKIVMWKSLIIKNNKTKE